MARSDEPPGPGAPPWVEETEDRMRAAGFAGLEVAAQTFGGVLHRALLGVRPAQPEPEKRVAPPSTPRRTG